MENRKSNNNEEKIIRTTEKKCPHCGSRNVKDTGDRLGKPENLKPGDKYSEPNQIVFECEKCKTYFALIPKSNKK